MKKQRSATEGKANGCANRVESRACSSYPEVKPAIDEVGVGSEWDYSSLRQKAKVQRREVEAIASKLKD